jgi:hypothetical protein
VAIEIGKPLALVRAGRYSDPGDPAAIIPEVYGDLTVGGIAGPVPAVLINKTDFVYAAAAHAVDSIADVYVGEIRQTAGFATATSTNYEGEGVIATIDFAAQPDGDVTWRGRGKTFGTGGLITNCISQLANLLSLRAGFPLSIADIPSWRVAQSLVDKYDFRTAFVVWDQRDVAAWIQEMLFNVMGRAYLRGDGTIVVAVDDGGSIADANAVQAHIVASRDCVDGDAGVAMSGQDELLVNALDLYYLWNWALGSASSRIVTTGDAVADAIKSRRVHGEARKAITLRGVRRASDLLNWAYVLYRRQSFVGRTTGARVEFAVEGPKLAHTTIGDLIGFTWAYGPVGFGGRTYRNQILQIVGVDFDPLRGGRASVTAIDTGQRIDSDDVLA